MNELLSQLTRDLPSDIDIIVIDNGSNQPGIEQVKRSFPNVEFIRLPDNIGAAGRNAGIELAQGEVIITLDDDVLGLNKEHIKVITNAFSHNQRLGALCFQVVNYHDGHLCNWCHPYDADKFFNQEFETCEITEGAVAYRRSVLDKVGLYANCYFLSNEGADLACRIIDAGYEIHYTPHVSLRHKYSPEARPDWRRYYYDTRNHFFLAIRNYRLPRAIRYTSSKTAIMLIYSLRDGYLAYWLNAVIDALVAIPDIIRERKPISKEAEQKITTLCKNRMPFFTMARRKLFLKQVKL